MVIQDRPVWVLRRDYARSCLQSQNNRADGIQTASTSKIDPGASACNGPAKDTVPAAQWCIGPVSSFLMPQRLVIGRIIPAVLVLVRRFNGLRFVEGNFRNGEAARFDGYGQVYG